MSATITSDECDAVLAQGRAARRANANLKIPPPELDAFLANYWRVGWMREHDEIALTGGRTPAAHDSPLLGLRRP